MSTTPSVPRLPALLGYAGLVPFVTLAGAAWLASGPWDSRAIQALLAYGAVILSFMGAVHWGLGMRNSETVSAGQLGLSVVPALLAWVALLLPDVWSFSVLVAAFGALCVVDGRATRQGLAPAWYPRLRRPLTIIVIISLVVALASVV